MKFTKNEKVTVLVFSLYHGGAEKVCLTLCNELVNRNYKIELWIVDSSETSLSKQLDEKITIYRLNRKHVRNSVLPLLKLFIQRKPEKILIFHIELAILAIIFKKIFFLKTQIIVRSINTLSLAFSNAKGSLRNYLRLKVLKYVLPFSNKIIAQSNGMRIDLEKNFNIESNKILTIFNPAFHMETNVAGINKIGKLENEFLFVGRLQPQKGLKNLIKIFEMAHSQNPNIQLTIVGEGPEEETLKKLVDRLGLNSSIIFEGYQAQTISYFERAKATVLTSVYEGFPNVLVESIAVGTPVIAFNCPSGPEDIIEQGVNGILVPNQDLVEFSNAILKIAKEEITFKSNDIIESSKRFSIETVVNKYEQVFLSV